MSGEERSARHLFDHWSEVKRLVRRAGRIALMLDFDGTLAPLCRHPGDVQLPGITRAVLRRLAGRPRARIAIISGRRRPDLRRRVGIRGISYLGLHGWERGQNQRATIKLHRFMQRMRREVELRLRETMGVWIEDKYVGFTVHCRLTAPSEVRSVRSALKQVLASHTARVRILDGKKVWEVLPTEVKGKGDAALTVLKEIGPALPFYAGDDLSDEAAFEALPRGITVRVGTPGGTHARFQLRDPEEVREFLERLEKELS